MDIDDFKELVGHTIVGVKREGSIWYDGFTIVTDKAEFEYHWSGEGDGDPGTYYLTKR